MTLELSLDLLAIAALLAASAFFSGSETALTAVSKVRMHHLTQEGSRRAAHVLTLIANRESLIGAVLLGNNFVNILASALATSLALEFFDEGGIVVATVAMTAFILIFSEVMPKTFAITHTDRVALLVAAPVRILVFLLAPIVAVVKFIVWRILYLFGIRSTGGIPVLTAHEELRGVIDLHHQEGGVESEHRHMLGGILDLSELKVEDVMVHRKNMVTIDAGANLEETVEVALSSGHTRIPVWKDDQENIVGVLHIKDLLRFLTASRGSMEGLDIMALATEPWFVPETTTLEEQVHAFRERRAHFALVVDEYGTIEGLITLEDILEEVFGNIAEVYDDILPQGIRQQPDGSYNIDGWTPVREINRELNWELPDEDATTLAGLVINEARTIPDVGQKFAFHGFKFQVLRKQRNQITALRVTPPKELADRIPPAAARR
jgi:Mg2+/Co2+ transporter CorB